LAPCYGDLVREGDAVLANELPIYTAILVDALTEITWEKPELVKETAMESIAWPMMVTRHYPKKSDLARLADQIGLASKSPVRPKAQHTWKPYGKLNSYLLRMVDDLGDKRMLTKENVPYYLDILMPIFEGVAKEEGGWENYEEFAAIGRTAARRGKAGVQRSAVRNRVRKALNAFAC
jgi:hypothetical protein